MADVFKRYAPYYDLLNRDKPYEAESDFIAATLSAFGHVQTILELGSGTGVHAELLAQRGFVVQGVDRSVDMVAMATARTSSQGERLQFTTGDVRSVSFGRTFDAVVSLFHVVSYMTEDSDVAAIFSVAAEHLEPGGLFLFDVWHAPAVTAQQPSARERRAEQGPLRIVRRARPEWRREEKVVVVNFDFECANAATGDAFEFTEAHPMRYFDEGEIDAFAEAAGFARLTAGEMVSGAPPSCATWAVTYVMRRQAGAAA